MTEHELTSDEAAPAGAKLEVGWRLTELGIGLTGEESGEDLASLLEAVEGFECVVGRQGGDLLLDEPMHGRPLDRPDAPEFVLPRRREREPVGTFVARVHEAARRAREVSVDGAAPETERMAGERGYREGEDTT